MDQTKQVGVCGGLFAATVRRDLPVSPPFLTSVSPSTPSRIFWYFPLSCMCEADPKKLPPRVFRSQSWMESKDPQICLVFHWPWKITLPLEENKAATYSPGGLEFVLPLLSLIISVFRSHLRSVCFSHSYLRAIHRIDAQRTIFLGGLFATEWGHSARGAAAQSQKAKSEGMSLGCLPTTHQSKMRSERQIKQVAWDQNQPKTLII